MIKLSEEEAITVITSALDVYLDTGNQSSFLKHVEFDRSRFLPLWLIHYQNEDGTHDGVKALQDLVAWPSMTRLVFNAISNPNEVS